MNLAYRFPIICWNTACLIAEASGGEEDEFLEESLGNLVIDEDEDDEEEKKSRAVNFGKIATAIGKFRKEGIVILPPDINKSDYSFMPDIDENIIRYGLSGISGVGREVVQDIIKNRPYNSMKEFLEKVKVNKTQMTNLIKSGAFDWCGDRIEIMKEYIKSIAGFKTTLNLRNLKMLYTMNLIPKELKFNVIVYNFNKELKLGLKGSYYYFNEKCYNFYKDNFDEDNLVFENEEIKILKSKWDKEYKKLMDELRNYIKNNLNILLEKVNNNLFNELWNKNCSGSISKWEMDSVSFYSHEHELKELKTNAYSISLFSHLSEEPEIERSFNKNGKEIILYEIKRIAGTIIDKNKNKNTVTLLTTDGVVTVKIFGEVFNHYNRQISQKFPDGTKKVLEKSWFKRGNKVIISGIRKESNFIAKKYKNTPWHLVELITDIGEDGFAAIQHERLKLEEDL